MSNNRVETSTSGWSNLCEDLCFSLLNRLSRIYKFRFRAVCKSWRSLANSYILMKKFKPQPPLLMIPSLGFDYILQRVYLSPIFSQYFLYKVGYKELKKFQRLSTGLEPNKCLGSSKGWLVFSEKKKKRYYIYNPVIDVCVGLGSLPQLITSKIVLWLDPVLSGGKYAVVAIHGCRSEIAYAICGDDDWRLLKGDSHPYCDIICDKNCLYALSESGSIEAWKFHNSLPVKRIKVQPPFPPRNVCEHLKEGVSTSRCYLVKSPNNLFMVVRNIEVLGRASRDYEAKIGHMSSYWSWQCKTLSFQVYILEINGKNCVKLDSLGDNIIVLGANHSLLLLSNDFDGYEKNSIYFSDECDAGVFNIRDGSIRLFLENSSMNAHPPSFWIVPQFNL